MKNPKAGIKLKLNLQKDIEETQIRLILAQDDLFKLEMLAAFRPGASLRSINNTRRANLVKQKPVKQKRHFQN